MAATTPTLRTLAKEAGVGPMTVSLALRDSTKIAAATRTRIRRLAELRGYRADPAITKLMHHLRARAPARTTINICGLTDQRWIGQPGRMPFGRRVREGVRQRAMDLGFAFDVLPGGVETAPAQLRRILRSRGVEGIVILPMPHQVDLSTLLDWGEFSVVCVTSSVIAPVVHRVMPNHFDNMLRLCRELVKRGYRRIGLAITREWDERMLHRWTGAVAWHNTYAEAAPIPPFLDAAPNSTVVDPSFVAWMRRHGPDAVIVEGMSADLWALATRDWPGGVLPALISFSSNDQNPVGVAGLDQCAEEIGAGAIDLLAGMIVRGERGIPARPKTLLVEGVWVESPAFTNAVTGARTGRDTGVRRAGG